MACVLVVDDEQLDQVILGKLLERAGHEVYFASDGAQAFDISSPRRNIVR